jgi:hypothetical protein
MSESTMSESIMSKVLESADGVSVNLEGVNVAEVLDFVRYSHHPPFKKPLN